MCNWYLTNISSLRKVSKIFFSQFLFLEISTKNGIRLTCNILLPCVGRWSKQPRLQTNTASHRRMARLQFLPKIMAELCWLQTEHWRTLLRLTLFCSLRYSLAARKMFQEKFKHILC